MAPKALDSRTGQAIISSDAIVDRVGADFSGGSRNPRRRIHPKKTREGQKDMGQTQIRYFLRCGRVVGVVPASVPVRRA